MFKIIHLDGTQKIPDDDICYILAKGGTYLKKKVGLIESLTPVKQISILEDVQPYARMDIPKIHGEDFGKIMSFFKKVYEEYRSEAIVLLYYNSKKSTYTIHVPFQKVNGGSVDYVKGISLPNHIQIGTIHSHANFSAFHSGVDDKDEEHFDGIHITIGDNMDQFPSIAASIVVNGTRFQISPIDYITKMEVVEYTKYFPQMFRPSFVEINGEKEYKKDVKSSLGYQLFIAEEDKAFDPKWLEMVEDSRPARTITNYLDVFQQGNGFGGVTRVPQTLWDITKKHKSNRPKYDPCSTCVFKNYKSNEENLGLINEKEDNKEAEAYEGFDSVWNTTPVYDNDWWK